MKLFHRKIFFKDQKTVLVSIKEIVMIDLQRFMKKSIIISDLKADTKEGVIKELINAVISSRKEGSTFTREDVFSEVYGRENMSSTGIGFGIAIPHARIQGWGEFSLAIGVKRTGIDFNSSDNHPAKIVCLMISSAEEPYVILQATATLLNFFESNKGVEHFIGEYSDSLAILKKFHEFRVDSDDLILAKDIIRPVQAQVLLDDPVEKATRLMHFKRADVLPVVDEKNKLCGQISCSDIFQYGMPDFFKNLNTVSFVRHIDPFEKYFRIQRDLKVKHLYQPVQPISQDKTLLEIIFALTVKKNNKLFVVNDQGELLGAIDRFTIIDKILIF